MSKAIRIGSLFFFFVIMFVLVVTLIRMQQKYLGDIEEPLLGGIVENQFAEEDDENADPNAPSAEEVEQMNAAISSGRALFETPSPLSPQEISDLVTGVQTRQRKLDEREAALNQKEDYINNMMEDLERNRANLMTLAQEVESLGASVTTGADTTAELPLDEENIARVAKLLTKMDPEKAATVLQARTPEQGAAILIKIKDDRKATAILQSFSQENLAAVTDALLLQKKKNPEEE